MSLEIEVPSFPHAVLYHPAVAAPGAAAVSDGLSEPQAKEPWIALHVCPATMAQQRHHLPPAARCKHAPARNMLSWVSSPSGRWSVISLGRLPIRKGAVWARWLWGAVLLDGRGIPTCTACILSGQAQRTDLRIILEIFVHCMYILQCYN